MLAHAKCGGPLVLRPYFTGAAWSGDLLWISCVIVLHDGTMPTDASKYGSNKRGLSDLRRVRMRDLASTLPLNGIC